MCEEERNSLKEIAGAVSDYLKHGLTQAWTSGKTRYAEPGV